MVEKIEASRERIRLSRIMVSYFDIMTTIIVVTFLAALSTAKNKKVSIGIIGTVLAFAGSWLSIHESRKLSKAISEYGEAMVCKSKEDLQSKIKLID